MSVPKVIALLLLTAGFRRMLIPPHRPPPRDEIVPTIVIDILSIRKYRLAFTRAGQMALAIAEVATMLAQLYPLHRVSRIILSYCLSSNSNTHTALNFTPLGAIAALMWGFGTILRLRAFDTLGKFFHFDVSIQKDHELVTNGAYSWVRHPSYSGLLLASLGWTLWQAAPSSWLRQSGLLDTNIGRALVAAYVLLGIIPINAVTLGRMKREDELLRKEFGQKWDEWREKVPYYVVPGLY